MFNDINQPPPPLPEIDLQNLAPGVSLLAPLTRRGHGPGLILLVADNDAGTDIIEGVPSHLIKWAEEGYTVVEIQEQALKTNATEALNRSLEAINGHSKCDPKGKVGLVVYEPTCWNLAAEAVNETIEVVATVVYADLAQKGSLAASKVPALQHLVGEGPGMPTRSGNVTTYHYPKAGSYKFATPFQNVFHYTTEALSHTRNLTHLKQKMDGPYFDLEYVWEEHTYYEFADRSVEHTMSTMVQEPYVNHVPTLTGGVGRARLTDFYRNNFIFNNSADTSLDLISRSIAIDRIIDEFIFSFTHDRELDWLVPGVPPTFKKVKVPFTAVVNIRGDRLYHEHIAWDQSTVLRQLGLLPEYLPFPYPVTDAKETELGSAYEYRLPVLGTETAKKLQDRSSVESNAMFKYKVRKVPLV